MSASNFKWELGVVEFSESFENFDRYTTLASATSAYTTTLSMNTSVTSDYTESPMWLSPRLPEDGSNTDRPVLGSQLWLGPSSNSTYDGAVDRVTAVSISGATVTLFTAVNFQHVTTPAAAYASGDQVLARTVPLGWTPNGSDFSSYHYGVMPIVRYDERHSHLHISENAGYAALAAYERTYKGVRLVNNHSTADSAQYIHHRSGLNTANPMVRAHRISWYYRIVRASILTANPSGVAASITMVPQDAAGNHLASQGGESPSPNGTLVPAYTLNYTNITNTSGAWQFEQKVVGSFTGSSYDHSFFRTGTNLATTTNPSLNAYNRLNRWGVRLAIPRGINTAFDVDDLIIEHAHGTSDETVGYYTIDDFPVEGSVSWDTRDNFNKQIMLNGSIKISRQSLFPKPKYTLSCDWQDVSQGLYYDLMALLNWQNQEGFLLCLRPYGTSLPSVLVGTMQLSRPSVNHWDASRVSFSMQFEEV